MKLHMVVFLFLVPFALLLGCTSTQDWGHTSSTKNLKLYQTGIASYYGKHWAGRPTASGKIFDPGILTAASKTLPFNSKVMVVNPKTKRYVIVTITDRGPYVGDRIIDLSEEAAHKLGMIHHGLSHVEVYLISPLKQNS